MHRRAWAWCVMGASVVVAAVAGQVAGTQSEPSMPAPLSRGPSIQFVDEVVDLGVVTGDQPVEFAFYFKNTGDQPLVIEWAPRLHQQMWVVERCPNVRIGPRIEVLWDVFDFGAVGDDAEDLMWEFTWTNVGDEPLRIDPVFTWSGSGALPGPHRK